MPADDEKLLIYEQHGYFAPALRQVSPFPVREVRSVQLLREALRVESVAAVALEATPENIVDVLGIAATTRRYLRAAVILLASREGTTDALRSLGHFAFEFGVDQVVRSSLELAQVEHLLIRCAGRSRSAAWPSRAAPDVSESQDIWARLPWPRHAKQEVCPPKWSHPTKQKANSPE